MKNENKYLGIIEIDDSVFYIQHNDVNLIAGTVSNAGFIPLYEKEIEDCLSIDENLGEFIDQIEESEYKFNQ